MNLYRVHASHNVRYNYETSHRIECGGIPHVKDQITLTAVKCTICRVDTYKSGDGENLLFNPCLGKLPWDIHDRGRGRTREALRQAPHGAIYVAVDRRGADYCRSILRDLRMDRTLSITWPDRVRDLAGIRATEVIIDHAARFRPEDIERLLTLVMPPEPATR